MRACALLVVFACAFGRFAAPRADDPAAAGKGSQEPVINERALFESPKAASPAAYASITLAGKFLFLNSNKGEIVVFEAPLVSRIRLSGGTGSSPVFSGKDMFLRNGDRLLCIGE